MTPENVIFHHSQSFESFALKENRNDSNWKEPSLKIEFFLNKTDNPPVIPWKTTAVYQTAFECHSTLITYYESYYESYLIPKLTPELVSAKKPAGKANPLMLKTQPNQVWRSRSYHAADIRSCMRERRRRESALEKLWRERDALKEREPTKRQEVCVCAYHFVWWSRFSLFFGTFPEGWFTFHRLPVTGNLLRLIVGFNNSPIWRSFQFVKEICFRMRRTLPDTRAWFTGRSRRPERVHSAPPT